MNANTNTLPDSKCPNLERIERELEGVYCRLRSIREDFLQHAGEGTDNEPMAEAESAFDNALREILRAYNRVGYGMRPEPTKSSEEDEWRFFDELQAKARRKLPQKSAWSPPESD